MITRRDLGVVLLPIVGTLTIVVAYPQKSVM